MNKINVFFSFRIILLENTLSQNSSVIMPGHLLENVVDRCPCMFGIVNYVC